MRRQIVTFWETRGPGIKEAAEQALLGGPEVIKKFLDEAGSIEHDDNRVDAARRAMAGGPAVRQAVKDAMLGSPASLQTFLLYGYETPLDDDRRVDIELRNSTMSSGVPFSAAIVLTGTARSAAGAQPSACTVAARALVRPSSTPHPGRCGGGCRAGGVAVGGHPVQGDAGERAQLCGGHLRAVLGWLGAAAFGGLPQGDADAVRPQPGVELEAFVEPYALDRLAVRQQQRDRHSIGSDRLGGTARR